LVVPGQYFIGNSKENVGYDGYIGGEKKNVLHLLAK